ncbi:MAG: nucleoside-diphosphate kinase [Candidatus Thermoplasmatota archaeon]|nr:nucleoside-diphosphate kinase [Candidatus Thermoplasmatota archaeon]
MERTLVLIKPDGIKRRLSGEIISRFERKGLKILGMKMLKLDRKRAEAHYAVHRDKPFYNELVNYITSDPIIAMVLEGRSVISVVRGLAGSTDGSKAVPGTIRGDYANSIQMNIVHASDSQESYEKEVAIFFNQDEIHGMVYGDEGLI